MRVMRMYSVYIYIYIYMCVCVCIYIYIYIHTRLLYIFVWLTQTVCKQVMFFHLVWRPWCVVKALRERWESSRPNIMFQRLHDAEIMANMCFSHMFLNKCYQTYVSLNLSSGWRFDTFRIQQWVLRETSHLWKWYLKTWHRWSSLNYRHKSE